MTIWCKHFHRLELFFNFCTVHLPVERDLQMKFPISDMHVQNKIYRNFVSISPLTGKWAAQKLKNFCSSSLCLHHSYDHRSQNKITNFFMILAWMCRFNQTIQIWRCLFSINTIEFSSFWAEKCFSNSSFKWMKNTIWQFSRTRVTYKISAHWCINRLFHSELLK